MEVCPSFSKEKLVPEYGSWLQNLVIIPHLQQDFMLFPQFLCFLPSVKWIIIRAYISFHDLRDNVLLHIKDLYHQSHLLILAHKCSSFDDDNIVPSCKMPL